MNNSETWVSHTPETTSTTPKDEDFRSVLEALNPPPSPPSAFEKFFLPFESTGGNTATTTKTIALAAKHISTLSNTTTSRKFHSTKSIASESNINVSDFCSAADNFSGASDELEDYSLDSSIATEKNSFINDILGRDAIFEETTYLEETMPVQTAAAEATCTTPKFDVVENVYEGAKSVWAFGKGIIIFKPFMGVAEGTAAKVLSVTAGVSSLEDADKHIKDTLAGVDAEFIDPAIIKVWSVLEPVIGKGEDVLKSVLGVVGKKSPMLEVEKTANHVVMVDTKLPSEEATAPETSTPNPDVVVA